MTTPTMSYSDDDLYILGNIASLAVKTGIGEQALPILKLVQQQRPNNAAAFIVESMYLFSIGKKQAALSLLETCGAFDAEKNRDEALAFHLYLLQQDGQLKRAVRLGTAYLEERLIDSKSAIEATRLVTTECQKALGTLLDGKTGANR
ncbi:hypothetical protein FJU08_16020 [Martelella alba]|uniref:Tetratricopeptide repeat protein n=1 Tax=Martelella alba TaxID=2590451 RepID=A0A506U6Y5_9HYPH|nr:hypothetical protein [Martelella alba]TPW28834.1 hypothetical protein FJU08_16020 [Martelella alba]